MRSQELVECTFVVRSSMPAFYFEFISMGLLQDAEIWPLECFLFFSLEIVSKTLIRLYKNLFHSPG